MANIAICDVNGNLELLSHLKVSVPTFYVIISNKLIL